MLLIERYFGRSECRGRPWYGGRRRRWEHVLGLSIVSCFRGKKRIYCRSIFIQYTEKGATACVTSVNVVFGGVSTLCHSVRVSFWS